MTVSKPRKSFRVEIVSKSAVDVRSRVGFVHTSTFVAPILQTPFSASRLITIRSANRLRNASDSRSTIVHGRHDRGRCILLFRQKVSDSLDGIMKEFHFSVEQRLKMAKGMAPSHTCDQRGINSSTYHIFPALPWGCHHRMICL